MICPLPTLGATFRNEIIYSKLVLKEDIAVTALVIVVICSSGYQHAFNDLKTGRMTVMGSYVWNLSPLLGCAVSDVNLTCSLSHG